MPHSAESTVKKRRVFYVSGYDPRGIRTCYNACRQESSTYTGDTLHVSPRRKTGDYATSWTIRADSGACTEFTFLHWDDIIRDHWPKNPLTLTFGALRAYAVMFCNGTAVKALRCTPAVFAALIYPLITLIMMQLTAFVCAVSGYGLIVSTGIQPAVAAIGAGVVCVLILLCLYPIAEKIKAFWLLRIYIFFTSSKGSYGNTYYERTQLFGKHIQDAIACDDYDEILVISHSTGIVAAVSATAAAVRHHPHDQRVALLTLGQCCQLHACDRRAVSFHRDIDTLSQHPLFWLDVSSPPDGATFALSDPTQGKKERIKLISPQFHKAFPKKDYAALKRDFFRLHFQYIMTTPLPVPYDYFAILSGSLTLNERYS